MPTLSRTVRFCINPPAPAGNPADTRGDRNGYAGVPAMRGLGRYYEVTVTCAGELDPGTGYLVNIKDIDRAVRGRVIPLIERACERHAATDAVALLPSLLEAIEPGLPVARGLKWSLTPYHSVEMSRDHPGTVLLRQRFDFAASHRLHVASMNEAANREAFGKCNHAGGHGHNYQVEPCVEIAVGSAFSAPDLERVTERLVIERFDHKHLDQDTPDFAKAGITSTVENIARVCYNLLAAAIPAPARLQSVTVWETDRTSSTYPG